MFLCFQSLLTIQAFLLMVTDTSLFGFQPTFVAKKLLLIQAPVLLQ
jgi:hypothetical protein